MAHIDAQLSCCPQADGGMSRLPQTVNRHPQDAKHKARAPEGPGEGDRLIWLWQTGHAPKQPRAMGSGLARRHPEVQAVKATGRGKRRGWRFTLGEPLNPDARFLICKRGDYCLPQRVAVRIKSKKTTRVSGCMGLVSRVLRESQA